MDGIVMATKKGVSLSVGRGEKLPASKGAGLTEKGRALIDAMWPAYRTAIAAHFGGKLDADEARAFAGMLEKLRPRS